VSTRGGPGADFTTVLVEGLAPDGGLYLPERWPRFDADPATYPDLVAAVAASFCDEADLGRLARDAYQRFERLVPIAALDDDVAVLELFWGPTLAFKDYGLQLLGRFLARAAAISPIVVLGATSGDTGSAAIAACRDLPGLEVVILHPEGRVSEVQRRQMTTVLADNVHNIAIAGTFDDCQRIVKELGTRRGVSSVNSINWVRLMGQIPYYLWAAGRLGAIDVAVPTGNFGNVLSAWAAKRMGAPIRRLIIGTNRNRAVERFIVDGVLTAGPVVETVAPAMDIQIPSNLERLIFEVAGRDPERTAAILDGSELAGDERAALGEFEVFSFTDEEIIATIRVVYERSGRLVDPHTAVGVAAARKAGVSKLPVVVVGTAHPAKFPDTVASATGVRPQLPERWADLLERPERYTSLPAETTAVESYISSALGTTPRTT
jgi:threonine synthase